MDGPDAAQRRARAAHARRRDAACRPHGRVAPDSKPRSARPAKPATGAPRPAYRQPRRGAAHRGRPDESRAEYEAALRLHREVGNRRGEGTTLTGLGALLGDLRRTDEGAGHYAQALDIQRALGNRVDEANVLSLIAVQLGAVGRAGAGATHFEASLAISEELEDRVAIGEIVTNLGTLNLEQGRVEEGAACYERALAMHRDVGNRLFEGYVLGDIGRMHLRGLAGRRATRPEQALAIARETGERRQQARCCAASASWRSIARSRRRAGRRSARPRPCCVPSATGAIWGGPVGAAPWRWPTATATPRGALLAEARDLAARSQAGPESQLGRTVDALARALGRAPCRARRCGTIAATSIRRSGSSMSRRGGVQRAGAGGRGVPGAGGRRRRVRHVVAGLPLHGARAAAGRVPEHQGRRPRSPPPTSTATSLMKGRPVRRALLRRRRIGELPLASSGATRQPVLPGFRAGRARDAGAAEKAQAQP